MRHHPILLRLSGNHTTLGADRRLADRPALWVSNRTDQPLMIRISEVEVQGDSGWTNFARPSFSRELKFSEEVGKPAKLIFPHQAEESLGIFLPLPQAGKCRIKAVVLRRESFLEKAQWEIGLTLGRLHLFPWRYDTNKVPLVTVSSSRRTVEFYKPFCEAVSDEINAASIRQPAPEVSTVRPLGTGIAPRASAAAISKAREALRQKLKEFDEPSAGAKPAAVPAKRIDAYACEASRA